MVMSIVMTNKQQTTNIGVRYQGVGAEIEPPSLSGFIVTVSATSGMMFPQLSDIEALATNLHKIMGAKAVSRTDNS